MVCDRLLDFSNGLGALSWFAESLASVCAVDACRLAVVVVVFPGASTAAFIAGGRPGGATPRLTPTLTYTTAFGCIVVTCVEWSAACRFHPELYTYDFVHFRSNHDLITPLLAVTTLLCREIEGKYMRMRLQ